MKTNLTLQKEDGEIISEQKKILEEVETFYKTLYSRRDVMDVDLNTVAPYIPQLSEEDNALLEGPIIYAEIKGPSCFWNRRSYLVLF